MNLRIVLPAAAGLALALFSFKPYNPATVTRLTDGNYHLNGAKLSEMDIVQLQELSSAGFIFRRTAKNDKDRSVVTEEVVTTKQVEEETLTNMEALAKVESILSKYE